MGAELLAGAAIANTAYNVVSGERNAARAKKDTNAQNALNKEESKKISGAQSVADQSLKLKQKQTNAAIQRNRFSGKAASFKEAQGASTGPSSTLG